MIQRLNKMIQKKEIKTIQKWKIKQYKDDKIK